MIRSLALVTALLSGCAGTFIDPIPMPGEPGWGLFPGIAEHRPRAGINITADILSDDAVHHQCLESIKRRWPTHYHGLNLSGTRVLACADFPLDRELKPGQSPWCRILLTEDANTGPILEHEIRHCEGLMHYNIEDPGT